MVSVIYSVNLVCTRMAFTMPHSPSQNKYSISSILHQHKLKIGRKNVISMHD